MPDGAVEISRRLLEAVLAEQAADATAARLAEVDPAAIEGQEARVAFWMNTYNARLRHELLERPRRGSLLRHRRLFRQSSYRVGGHEYSLDVIEHGLLRRNARPPAALRRVLRAGDPRLAVAPPRLDPRLHFALNCGARSCPPVRAYDAAGVDAQLDAASRAYLGAESSLDRERGRLTLPGVCKLYRRDFEDLLGFAAAHLPEDDAAWLREHSGDADVVFDRFDWTLVPGEPA